MTGSRQRKPQARTLNPTQDLGAHRGDLSQGAAVVQQTSLWPGLASTPLRTTQLACDLQEP